MKIGLKQGFSLVEIALALLVIGIGVITVVGLFGSSLDAGSTARQEMIMGNFADMVFGSLDAMGWEKIPVGSMSTDIDTFSPPHTWNDQRTWKDGGVITLESGMGGTNAPVLKEETGSGSIIANLPSYMITYLYKCEIDSDSPLLKKVTLKVQYRQYGFDEENAQLFYREFYNWGAWK
ncbi:MAG: hypothetical protein EOL87_02740 [Spartobacteria bacterium]|nr:hypothetical protein [Spartobacteria bacterium]